MSRSFQAARSMLCLVATTLLMSTWAPPAIADIAQHRRAGRYLAEWQFSEARTLIHKLKVAAPNKQETRYLEAEMAFLDGNYEDSSRILSKMGDKDVGGNVGVLRKLVNGTSQATSGFKKVLSGKGHFEIHYLPGKDEVIVDLAGDALDRAYEVFAKDLGISPATPIRVEILGRPAALAKVSTLTENDIRTTNTIALCKYNKLMAVTPRATLFGYAWMDTLVHEYVHYVVSTATRDRVPVWLHEGIARLLQNRWRSEVPGELSGTDEYLLANALKKNDFVSFDDMHPSMAKLPSQEVATLAYAEVFTLVHYAHGRVGNQGLRRLLELIREGKDARVAVTRVLSKKRWKQVERDWKKYLASLKLSIEPALAGRARHGSIRFDNGGKDSENVGLSEIENSRAKKFARLGGLLRARGLLAAAAREYEKALSITGAKNPMLAGKLSRTYVGLKEYEKAIQLAEPLLKADQNDAAPAITLGLSYQATGQPKKAVGAFEVALRINPFDPAVRCGLASAYAQLRLTKREKREREACRRLQP